jgi:O-Antigen ligase
LVSSKGSILKILKTHGAMTQIIEHSKSFRLKHLMISILLFLAPVSEVTGHYYIPMIINISLPNVISILLLVLTASNVLFTGKLPKHMLYMLLVAGIVAGHVVFLSLININDRHSDMIVPIVGGLILLVSFAYWFKVDLHARLMSISLVTTGGLLALGGALLLLGVVDISFDQAREYLKFDSGRVAGFGFDFPRSTGISGMNMGAFGSYTEVAVFMLASMGLRDSSRKSRPVVIQLIIYTAAIALAVFVVALTQSRSLLIAMFAGATVFFALTYYEKSHTARINRLLTTGLLIAGLFVMGIVVWPFIVGLGEASVTNRIDVYYDAFGMFFTSPVMGNGFYGVSEFYNSHIVHNHFLSYVVAIGIPSAVLYFSLFVKAASNGVRYLRNGGRHTAFVIGILASFTAVIVELNLYSGLATPINFILLGILLTLSTPNSGVVRVARATV